MSTSSSSISPLSYLRYSIGIVYIWFGLLKFFPDSSPAEDLVIRTIEALSNHLVSGYTGLIIVAIWEVFLGICFMINQCRKPVLVLYFTHLLGTFTPLFLFPELTFHDVPLGFTIIGQYIMKNIVFVAGGMVLWRRLVRSDYQSSNI